MRAPSLPIYTPVFVGIDDQDRRRPIAEPVVEEPPVSGPAPEPLPPAPVDVQRPTADTEPIHDTFYGQLKRNWAVLSSIATLLLASIVMHFQLRADLDERLDTITSRLDRLETRYEGHVGWHRDGMPGNEPDPDQEVRSDPLPAPAPDNASPDGGTSTADGELIHPVMLPGEQAPSRSVTDAELLEAIVRHEAGEASERDEQTIEGVRNYLNVAAAESAGDVRIRSVDACVEEAVPRHVCRRMFSGVAFPVIDPLYAYDDCIATLRDAPRCRRVLRRSIVIFREEVQRARAVIWDENGVRPPGSIGRLPRAAPMYAPAEDSDSSR